MESFDNNSQVASALPRYQALLAMADLVVHGGEVNELFHQFAIRLKDIVSYDLINFCIYDAGADLVQLSMWEGNPGPPLPLELPASEAVTGWVCQHQQPMVFSDIEHETRFPLVMAALRQRGLRSYCVLPMISGQQRLGALGFASSRVSAYDQGDLDFLQRVTKLVAVALENSLNRAALVAEKERLEALLEVNCELASYSPLRERVSRISSSISRILPHDYFAVLVNEDAGDQALRVYQGAPYVLPELVQDSAEVLPNSDWAGFQRPIPEWVLTSAELKAIDSPLAKKIVEQGIGCLCCISLSSEKGELGTLAIGRRESKAVSAGEMAVLRQVAAQMAIALEHARAWREVAELKHKLAEEKIYLEDEIRTELNFEQIIGESEPLKRTLAGVRTVAPSDASVLILGETGTGKELIARAIHDMSSRKGKNFIKVNCAAIPSGLLESELFGHERGAFTGALNQKIGRIELAHEGTLFLDEVGDIPLELQPKLLRVVQEQEFERLGSNRTVKVNLRIIAATNRDMKRSVDAHEFRRDLFYRLNVFPLHVPPLRERRKDIPLLVRYFVQRFARRMNKPIETIPSETMNILVNWDWPGNVRELENFLERSVILTKGRTLTVPVSELQPVSDDAGRKDVTLQAAEREHILRILRESGGIISGVKGAAARLGLKRTTLQSKMQKLGIHRADYEN